MAGASSRPGDAPSLAPAAQQVIDRFVAGCRADARVVAAFLSGSLASGAADEHSDLDLGLIATDAAYDDVLAGREALVRRLGEPLLLETFGPTGPLFFILSDGTEGELAVGRESVFGHVAAGPHRVLLDRTGILDGVAFAGEHPNPDEQRETLRRLVMWFWHDLSHFITAMARDQRWWAYGELEVLRRSCAGLLRLRHASADADAGDEPYYKVDEALGAAQLAPLHGTLCTEEPADMLRAAGAIVLFYRSLAQPLAESRGVGYPHALERLLLDRLAALRPATGPV